MNHISIFTTNSIVTDKKVPIIFSLRIFMINRNFAIITFIDSALALLTFKCR